MSLAIKFEYEGEDLMTSIIEVDIDKIKENCKYEICETEIDPTQPYFTRVDLNILIKNLNIMELFSILNNIGNESYYIIFKRQI